MPPFLVLDSSIDLCCMKAVSNFISVISRRSVHQSMHTWTFSFHCPHKISFPSNWLLSYMTTIETMAIGEKRVNPVAMTITGPWIEIGQAGDRTSDPCIQVLLATH